MVKPTLKDIASDSGYSISTVSRVLNGSDKISTPTREKIFESASKLKYPFKENTDGHSKILNVALIVSGFHRGEFYASFYKGFTDAAAIENMMLSIVSISRPKASFLSLVKKLSKINDGLILFKPEFSRNDYIEVQKSLPHGYPIVSNGLMENPVYTTLSFDGYSGGHLAAEHFKKRGYTSCAVIKGPLQKAESRYRYNGFKDYIKQNASQKLVWEFNGDFTFSSGTAAFRAFQGLSEKPRAIFACNDAMCHAFLEAATKAGYRFPDDIAILGFDDLPICTRHLPTISSISTPYHKLGQQTLRTLQNIMDHRPANPHGVLSLLPVSLSVRNSS